MLIRAREIILLSVLSCYLVFNYGFSEIRVYTVPIAEICLVLGLLTLSPKFLINLFKEEWVIRLFLIWWLYSIIRLIPGFFEYHWWALRDANEVIESLYLFLGFICIKARPKFWATSTTWFRGILIVITVYSLGLPFQAGLKFCSPQIVPMAMEKLNSLSHQYHTAPIFFYYATTSIFVFISAVLFIFMSNSAKKKVTKIIFFLLSIMIIWYSIFYIQKRVQILQLLLCLLLFLLYDFRSCIKLFMAWIGAACLVIIMPLVNISLLGNQLLPITLKIFFISLLSGTGINIGHLDYHPNNKAYLNFNSVSNKVASLCQDSPKSLSNSNKKVNEGLYAKSKKEHDLYERQNGHINNEFINRSLIQGQAGGTRLRIEWWKEVVGKVMMSKSNFLFGLGYGGYLINFKAQYGIPVRNLHNFIVTKFARVGFIGLTFYLILQVFLFCRAFSLLKSFKITGDKKNYYNQLIFIVFLLSLVCIGLVEPMLSSPELTISYYFIFGVMLAKKKESRI